jgi:hypothetical protein
MKSFFLILPFLVLNLFSQGQETFRKVYGTGDGEYAKSIGHCLDGGFYLMGDKGGANYGGYIIKTDSSGTLIWEKIFHVDSASVNFNCGTELSDGSFILTYLDYTYGFPNIGTYQLKLNSSGDSLWCKLLTFMTTTSHIIPLENGEYIISGTYYNGLMGVYEGAISKLDQNGNTIAISNYNINYDEPIPQAMKMLSNGNIAIAGISTEHTITHPQESYLIITDTALNLLHTKIFRDTSNISLYAIENSIDGSITIAGTKDNPLSSFLARVDTLGIISWTKEILPYAYFNQLQQLPDSNYIALIDLNIFNGLNNTALVKLDYFGNILWERTYLSQYNTSIDFLSTNDLGFIIPCVIDTLNNYFGNHDILLVKTDSAGNSGCYEDHYNFQSGNSISLSANDTSINYYRSLNIINPFYFRPVTISSGISSQTICSSLSVIGHSLKTGAFNLYPNPSSGKFTIGNLIGNNNTIQIINPLGEIVYSEKTIGKDELVINPHLAAGFYFVQVSNEKGKKAGKLVVE